MKFLKKRSVAIIITVVVIILSTVFGVHRSLGHEARAVADQFSGGVYDTAQGYTRPSIRGQLDKRKDASLGLITIANNYEGVSDRADTLRVVRNRLVDALHEEKLNPSELYTINSGLQTAFDNLYKALESCDLDDKDRIDIEAYSSTFSGAASVIEKSGYNDTVREFNNSTLGVFPTNLLWRIAFIEKPQLFE